MEPHEILDVPRGASKAEVLKAAAKALRERKHSAKDIALAQRTLLDPAKTAAASLKDLDFSCFLRGLDAPAPVAPDVLAQPLDGSAL